MPGHPYEHGFDLRLVPDKLGEPLRWTDRRTVFVNSMSDLFHDAVPETYVRAVVAVMKATPWHTYQVLTKRADRLGRLLSGPLRSASCLSNGHKGMEWNVVSRIVNRARVAITEVLLNFYITRIGTRGAAER